MSCHKLVVNDAAISDIVSKKTPMSRVVLAPRYRTLEVANGEAIITWLVLSPPTKA